MYPIDLHNCSLETAAEIIKSHLSPEYVFEWWVYPGYVMEEQTPWANPSAAGITARKAFIAAQRAFMNAAIAAFEQEITTNG